MNPALFTKLAMAFTLVLSIFGSIGAMWLAHRIRVSPPPKRWGTDPGVPVPHFSVEKSGREEREKASGIVIDPGGTCLCRRCGHTVSAVYDHCDNCSSIINWNA